jgi:hypothetical protein
MISFHPNTVGNQKTDILGNTENIVTARDIAGVVSFSTLHCP